MRSAGSASAAPVRQGKRFEVEIDGEITDERLVEVREAAEKLFANTVIETFDVTRGRLRRAVG